MSLKQQKRLYEAEACLWGHGREFSTIREVVEYLDSVVHSHWFVKKYGYIPPIHVDTLNNGNRWAGCANRDSFTIYLRRRIENVVLHELAHLLCSTPDHDEEFVEILQHLIRNAMGFYAWAEFSYNLEKVNYFDAK